MNQVLQRTRPAAASQARSSSKLKGFLRSFLPGRRALMLLLLVGGGAALSTQMLQGLLRPDGQPGPGTPGGGGGSGESASSVESTDASPAASGTAPTSEPAAAAKAGRPVKPGAAPAADAVAVTPGARGGRPVEAARSRTATSASQASAGRRRPASPRPAAQAPQGVFAAFGSEDLPPVSGPEAPLAEAPVRAAAPLRGQAGVRELGSVSLSDLDPSQGVPCSDTTAVLPPGRPPEESWLPGSDASSLAGAEALDPIPVPPIYSESPELAAGPASPSLQAHRNSQCLKQPAGRN